MGRVFAAADIGSNTVHLLIAETTRTGLRRLHNVSDWLSLGEVVSREGRIPDELVLRLVETMRSFRDATLTFKSQGFVVFATEAMRSAENHSEILKHLKAEIGIKVDLISPRREAELSYQGIQLDAAGPEPCVLVELGGGSAQVAWCDRGKVQEDTSLPIGTGRLIAEAKLGAPVSMAASKRLRSYLCDQIERVEIRAAPERIVACGGVARGLWRALHPDGERTIFRQELDYIHWAVSRLDLAQIAKRFGVKPKRAATLYPGSLVYASLLDRFGVESMTISEYGVREGAIRELASRPASLQ